MLRSLVGSEMCIRDSNKGSKAKTSAANDTGGDNDQSRQPLTPGGQKQQKNREEEHQLFLAETVPKLLACGVQGDGAMASPRDIAITVDMALSYVCLLYTSDAADEEDSVDLGGRRII
eukprot:TRINITY_DN57839_c0_g1_i1.p1 TRINITY_DN57839_c0_g1~~TRINITY_DN57839_c0_g1_i1.p1  ORF type:complete len:118 (+),score=34.93 TRINITY_DN57839_c0_g1_i1:165-518(+)